MSDKDWLKYNVGGAAIIFLTLLIMINLISGKRAQTMLKNMDDRARQGEEHDRHLDRIATCLEARNT